MLDERADGGEIFHARGIIRAVVRETRSARDASTGRGAIDEYVRAEVQCRPVVLLLPPRRRDVEVVGPRLGQRKRRVELEKLSAPAQCSRHRRQWAWQKDLGRGRRSGRDPWTANALARRLTPSPGARGYLRPRRHNLGPYRGLTKRGLTKRPGLLDAWLLEAWRILGRGLRNKERRRGEGRRRRPRSSRTRRLFLGGRLGLGLPRLARSCWFGRGRSSRCGRGRNLSPGRWPEQQSNEKKESRKARDQEGEERLFPFLIHTWSRRVVGAQG